MRPHRLFKAVSIPGYCSWLVGAYFTWKNWDALWHELSGIKLLALVVAPFALGVLYILFVLFHSRPRPFGCARTWTADVSSLANEAHHLRFRFTNLKNAYGDAAFLKTLSSSEIPLCNSEQFSKRDLRFLEWNNDFDDHRDRLRTLVSAYHWWTHFRYAKPKFSLLESGSSDWEHKLIQHEAEIREILL
jgi:hypothetical protein